MMRITPSLGSLTSLCTIARLEISEKDQREECLQIKSPDNVGGKEGKRQASVGKSRWGVGKWGGQETKGKQQRAGKGSSMHLVLPGEGCLHSARQAQQGHSQSLLLILALQVGQLPAQMGCLLTMTSNGSDISCTKSVQTLSGSDNSAPDHLRSYNRGDALDDDASLGEDVIRAFTERPEGYRLIVSVLCTT
ncbi:MAG: hypothetical protein FRX49_11448 [Trebouxia sp. A1-2]|nr:MAG: hypothetical protein FRX49_11448 [Trebouxia sp. A1-2]